jgi:phosphoribosylanthranilate isomerase
MEIKVCGMRERDNCYQLVQEVNPEWMGLIFYSKSPRVVSDQSANQIAGFQVKKVGNSKSSKNDDKMIVSLF